MGDGILGPSRGYLWGSSRIRGDGLPLWSRRRALLLLTCARKERKELQELLSSDLTSHELFQDVRDVAFSSRSRYRYNLLRNTLSRA